MPSYFGSLPKEQAPTKYLSEGEAEVRAGEGGAGVGVGAGRTGPEAEAAAVEVGVEVGGAGRGVGAGGGGRGAGVQIPQLRGSRKSFKRIDPTDGGQRSMTCLFQRWAKTFILYVTDNERKREERKRVRRQKKERNWIMIVPFPDNIGSL